MSGRVSPPGPLTQDASAPPKRSGGIPQDSMQVLGTGRD